VSELQGSRGSGYRYPFRDGEWVGFIDPPQPQPHANALPQLLE